ncbi:MAG: hypothetical protein JXP34_01270, partial [Planctomycetes bacterium]|nr:hypothetical protein [Planctomycetota bacterium]
MESPVLLIASAVLVPALQPAGAVTRGGAPDRPLEIELRGATVVEPGSPPADLLRVTSRLDAPVPVAVEFSFQS